jgi:hypothetical protein
MGFLMGSIASHTNVSFRLMSKRKNTTVGTWWVRSASTNDLLNRNNTNNPKIRNEMKIVAKEKIDCDKLIGSFLDDQHYDILVQEDCDFFAPPNCQITDSVNCDKDCSQCPNGIDESRIAFVFRKNYFSKEEQSAAYTGLREAASCNHSYNRGAAAGFEMCHIGANKLRVSKFEMEILEYFSKQRKSITGESILDEIIENKKKLSENTSYIWLSNKSFKNFDEWILHTRQLSSSEQSELANQVLRDRISSTTFSNGVFSGVAGFFGRSPRLPFGRKTHYTENYSETFETSIPFLRTLDKAFKTLLPGKYAAQRKFVDKIDENFRIADTVFTTLTVNKTFRTAAHLDAGDLAEGFSNLLVLSNDGNYTGGYLILPEYRVAIDVRPGDLLLVANHTAIHGNTPIVLGSEESERISIVAYAREDLAELKTFEYENTRKKFVESRRGNKEHPLWRERWNGVSPNCFFEDEWKQFLSSELGNEKAKMYEPDLFSVGKNTLDEFF